MKICLVCDSEIPAFIGRCATCGNTVSRLEGFIAFAPDLAAAPENYSSGFYEKYVNLEQKHFWFTARRKLIIWLLRKYKPDAQSYFEVGCGTGFVMSGLAEAFPDARLLGSEMLAAGLHFAQSKVPSADFVQMDARKIPFEAEFDIAASFDVLEHIEDDGLVLSQMHKSLRPGGVIAISVPQHDWLWSEVDRHSCHVRRYSAVELHKKMEAAGFRILDTTSFVSLLLPAMYLSRVTRQRNSERTNPLAELEISKAVNAVFGSIMAIELFLIRCGIRFPLGGSRLVVAEKS